MKKVKTLKFWFFLGFFSLVLIFVLSMIGCAIMTDYKSAYEMTPSGVTEIKDIPESVVIESSANGEYFDKSNGLFIHLFNYIRDNDIPMTVPVEAGISSANMRFYIIGEQENRKLEDGREVKVIRVPAKKVASLGMRGSYSESNVKSAEKKLVEWITSSGKYKQTGLPYAVYWNSPFRLWFLKHYEIHVPVEEIPLK